VKFALDTNVFVDAFRDETFGQALAAFLEQALPMTFLSAVVVQELAAGTRTREQVRALESSILRPFERRRRVFAPSSLAFRESGRLLAELDRLRPFLGRWRHVKPWPHLGKTAGH